MNADSLERDINRAKQAARIMSDPLVQEAMTALKQGLANKWFNEHNESQREHLWRMVQTARQFETYFAQIIANGQSAQAVVDNINAIRKAETAYEVAENI